jgi:hypothetical protein
MEQTCICNHYTMYAHRRHFVKGVFLKVPQFSVAQRHFSKKASKSINLVAFWAKRLN